jgi:hypothetical protein
VIKAEEFQKICSKFAGIIQGNAIECPKEGVSQETGKDPI